MPVEHPETEVEKTCKTCHEDFPADCEFFFRDSRSADGLRSVCKACYYGLPSVMNRRREFPE